MFNIVHRIGIHASPAQVYNALTSLEGLAEWWTREVSGTPQSGENLAFVFNKPNGEFLGKMVMQVLAQTTDTEVTWRCVEGPEEWIGTEIVFALSDGNGQTIVTFHHRHWREESEMLAHCSMKWATFLLSLRESVETGRGKPSPQDLKIDDWN